MTKIKLLQQNLINQIAAGEVIERPASIIKELVENSVDAGASSIEIYINNGGKTLITIKDNGSGMAKDDLAMCLKMHATSKLNANNLFNITSMGFRGEALASIASVAKIVISSFDNTLQQGFSIMAQNSVINSNITASNIRQGTSITVTDLFFSTPARLKFLKADSTETLYCYATIKKLALANVNCSFKVYNNNKLVFNYTSIANNLQHNLQQRCANILGQNFIQNSISINETNELIELYGFVSTPTFNNANANLQYFNINGRYIKDKIINNAIKFAYNDVLASNKHPIFALWLNISPTEIDINVNPAKTEIRFKDGQLIRQIVYKTIKNALANTQNVNNNSFLANKLINASVGGSVPQQTSQHNNYAHSNYKHSNGVIMQENSSYKNKYNPQPKTTNNKMYKAISSIINEMQNQTYPETPNNTGNNNVTNTPNATATTVTNNVSNNLFNQNYPLGFAKAQLHNNWIISQTTNGFIVVDQHAAHERIMEEKFKKMYLENNIAVQNLLITPVIKLDPEDILILQEYKNEIKNMGILFTVNKQSITITALPVLLINSNPNAIINDIINNIKDTNSITSVAQRFKVVISKLACHYSIRSGRVMTITEMNELLREMEQTPNYAECSHGRPTFMEITLANLEKFFARTN